MTKLTSTILVLVNDDGKTDIESAIGNGKVLWSGRNGFEWIGKGKEEWESVFLIRYQNIPECQNAVERFKMSDLGQIELFAVKPVSKTRLLVIRFLMKYVFPRFSVKFSDEEVDLDTMPDSDILPAKEQHIQLAQADKGHPVVMVNLMEYFDQPVYPLDYEGKRSVTGRDAYTRYGNHAMRGVASLGGVLEHIGEVERILIGEQDEKWNQFALMRYPSHDSVRSMFRMKENPDVGIQRDAGLKNTRVYAFTPTE